MAFYVYRSNDLQRLIPPLAQVLASPGRSPLAPPCFVVPGPGVARWLALELARQTGLFAHATFLTPASLPRWLLTGESPDNTAEPFTSAWFVWALFRHIPALVEHPECIDLRRQVGASLDERSVWRVACQLAPRFASLPLYRPDLVARWERGEQPEAWAAMVWRAVVAHHGSSPLQQSLRLWQKRDGLGPNPRPTQQLILFGVTGLAPLLFDLLERSAIHRHIHGFFWSASQEHWANIRKRSPAAQTMLPLDEDEGHPLLASLGRVGRDDHFFLEERTQYVERGEPLYVQPPPATALSVLQSDVLHLQKRGLGAGEVPPVPWAPDDLSLSLHACHTPLREVEVLYDQLLHLMATSPGLRADDMLVLAPDMGVYAPLVDAVFGQAQPAPLRYRILDRAPSQTNHVEASFFALLDAASGRVTARELLDLLEREPVRRRFEIDEADLPDLATWVTETNVRWGIDSTDRAGWNLPPFHETTWRFGLDRLLLGCVMPDDDEPFGATLPYRIESGKKAEVVGKFSLFCETMFDTLRLLRQPHRPLEWRDLLLRTMENLLCEDELDEKQSLLDVRDRLDHLTRAATAAECEQEVSLATWREGLTREQQAQATSHPLFSGGISFATLRGGQVVPHKVVALLGMHDGAFPRSAAEPGLRLIGLDPRRGDPSEREQERYLFLEALLSARSHVLITYVGQSVKDRTKLPPAGPVSDLLAVLNETFSVDDAPAPNAPAAHRFVTWHPLQPFSTRYFAPRVQRATFAGAPLITYQPHHAEGARALLDATANATPFLSGPLPPEAPIDTVEIDDLLRFFRHPVQAFVQRRLGLTLPRTPDKVSPREPLLLASGDAHRVGAHLLARLRANEAATSHEAYFRAQGALPVGNVGTCSFEAMLEPTTALAERLREYTPSPPREVATRVGALGLVGTLSHVTHAGLVRARYGMIRPNDMLQGWLEHLIWLTVAQPTDVRQTRVFGLDRSHHVTSIEFDEVDAPELLLQDLLALYVAGHSAPLGLFADASLAYVESLSKHADERWERAAQTFASAIAQRGHSGLLDPYLHLVLDGANPFYEDFSQFCGPEWGGMPAPAEVAERVFAPLLRSQEKLRGGDV